MNNIWIYIGRFSDCLSFVSAIVGVLSLLKIRKLEFRLARRERLPDLTDTLKDQAGELLSCFAGQSASSDEAFTKLAQVEATLISIRKIGDGDLKVRLKRVLKQVQVSRVERSEAEKLRPVYDDLMHIVQIMTNAREEDKWKM